MKVAGFTWPSNLNRPGYKSSEMSLKSIPIKVGMTTPAAS